METGWRQQGKAALGCAYKVTFAQRRKSGAPGHWWLCLSKSECSVISLSLALEAGAAPHPGCKVLSVETEAESGSKVASIYCII